MKRSLALAIPLLILAASALSLPRLAVEYAASCDSCHVNPTGAGMRTEFGNYSVAYQELTLQSTRKLLDDRYRSPRLAEGVTLGFDTRHLFFDDGSVFRMQTDFYLAVEPFDDLTYQVRVGESGISENYALLRIDDGHHYVKAGRFSPAYGLRPADHTAFIRSRTGNPSLLYLDGLSLGTTVAETRLSLEAFDRTGQGIYGLHAYRPFALETVSLFAGVSLRVTEEVEVPGGSLSHAKAAFGGLSLDRFTLMGEVDLVGKGNDTLVVYGNLTTRIAYGLYLVGEYNFFDGDRNRADGTEEFIRTSVELYPIPFVLLRPSYTRYTDGPRKDENDFFIQFHVGY
ncbi:hypothetical protein KQH82_01165 [bacterium]|nr:hypothetical protein [bacterium]